MRLRRQDAPRRLDHDEFGVQLRADQRIDDQFSPPDIVDRDHARQDGHPVRARHEFERGDHRIHFQNRVDLHPVRLEISLEIAATDIVRSRQHDLERPAVGEAQRRERLEPGARPRQQHFAVAHQQPRFQADRPLEGRHDGEVELVIEHHLGEKPAIALDDVQPHFRAARHKIVEHRRQHRAGEGRHQADAQFARDLAGGGARLLGGFLERADGADTALVIAQARRRRRDPTGNALEQPDAELPLHRRHVLGNARLCGVFPLRRARERALLADRDDGSNLTEGNVAHASSIRKINGE